MSDFGQLPAHWIPTRTYDTYLHEMDRAATYMHDLLENYLLRTVIKHDKDDAQYLLQQLRNQGKFDLRRAVSFWLAKEPESVLGLAFCDAQLVQEVKDVIEKVQACLERAVRNGWEEYRR
jgi:hypothetical protein